jgi:hypothetical protein
LRHGEREFESWRVQLFRQLMPLAHLPAAYFLSPYRKIFDEAPGVLAERELIMENTLIRSTFWYFKEDVQWERVKPYFIYAPITVPISGFKSTNEESIPVDNIAIHDIRAQNEPFDIDVSGFVVLDHDFSHAQDEAFYAGEFKSSEYKSEITSFLVKNFGVESVTVLSSSIRKRDRQFPKYIWGTAGENQPIQGVHIGKLK